MKVGVLYSRVRVEEKLLFEALERRGVAFDLLDDQDIIFEITDSEHRTPSSTVNMMWWSSAVLIMAVPSTACAF